MKSTLDRFFKLTENKTTLKTEVMAGLTTFSTMAYIIFVNPQILSLTGMDFGAVMVATILAAALATLCMGLYANYPFALAPGMGLNAFFTYGIVFGNHTTWQIALGTCFWAGIIFFVLNILGIRQTIMHAIPESLRTATAAGIGIFVAFIGFQNIHLIETHPGTLLTIGKVATPEILLTAFGVIVIAALMARQVKGAILIGIILNWLIGLATGLVEWKGFVSLPPSLSPTLMQMDLIGSLTPTYMTIILSLVFVAIFDTTGTLLGLAAQGNFLNKQGKLPRTHRIFHNDALGTVAGAALGTSMLTIYLESTAGIATGGRTGLTAVVVALGFLISLFLSPLASSIPHFATTPVLIIIGALMLKHATSINWEDPTEYIPAFIILIGIPLTFSIASGIALGLITFPLIKLLAGRGKELHPIIWVIAAIFLLKFIYT